jgi:hypothetical protein
MPAYLYRDALMSQLPEWAWSACDAFGYPRVDQNYIAKAVRRLTPDVAEWLGYGLATGLILGRGYLFDIIGNPAGKGPYAWFAKDRSRVPQCDWEYFLQAAYFVRLYAPCQQAGLALGFEDHLMDLTVRSGDELLWYIEVKERVEMSWLEEIVDWGTQGVDVHAADRGRDGLRKGKYLVRHHPRFFSAVGTGFERHFRVEYPASVNFTLIEGVPPVQPLSGPPAA